MTHHNTGTNELLHCHHYKLISWSAMLVGALVAVGLGFLLNLFGAAIGLSAITTDADQTSIAIGGFLGLLVGTIAVMLVAGYTAGYLGRLYSPRENLGVVYGFGTWTIALIIAALVAGPVATHLAGYASLAGNQPIAGGEATQATEQVQNMNLSPSALTWASFMVFFLFFIGALSACFGAYWGMSRKIEDYNYNN